MVMDFHACFEQYTDCCLVFAEVSDRLPMCEWATKNINVKVLPLKKQNDVENEELFWFWLFTFGQPELCEQEHCYDKSAIFNLSFLRTSSTDFFSHRCHSLSLYSETSIHHSCVRCLSTIILHFFWSRKLRIWTACHYIGSIVHQSVIFLCHLFKIPTPDTQYA